MKKVLAAVLMVLACCAAYAETDYTVERKVDYLWRHVVGSGGGGGGDYPTKGWVTDKISAEAQARSAGDATVSGQVSVLSGSVNNISNRVVTLEAASGDYVTEDDVYGIIKDMITDGGIIIGDYEYKLVVETVRNLADSVLRFADGTVIVTNIVGTFPSTYAGNTNLVSLELGTGVTGIGQAALQNCTGLTNLVFSDSGNVTFGRLACNNIGVTSLTFPSGAVDFPLGCFGNCLNLKTVYFNGYVTELNGGPFTSNPSAITDMTFAVMTKAQVQSIYGYSQTGVYGLHGVTIHCTDGNIYLP